MSFRLGLAIVGSLQEKLAADLKAGETAVTAAMDEAGQGLKNAYRQDIVGAGLGRRLANTWRHKRYPDKGKSLKAAVLVYNNAPEIVEAHAAGATIRANSAKFLAIPTQNAPKLGRDKVAISPTDWPNYRYGPLRFVKTKRGGLLVVDGVRVTAKGRISKIRGRKATKTKGAYSSLTGRATVVMFVLVRQVRLRKRLDLDGPARVWLDRVPELIVRNWPDT